MQNSRQAQVVSSTREIWPGDYRPLRQGWDPFLVRNTIAGLSVQMALYMGEEHSIWLRKSDKVVAGAENIFRGKDSQPCFL